jgi:hypothetical protein
MKKIFHKDSIFPVRFLVLGLTFFLLQQIALSQEIEECVICHMDKNLTKKDSSGKVHSLYVDETRFKLSIHGELNYTCVDCHEEATANEHPAEGITDVDCSECHEEVLAKYKNSNHGQLAEAGNLNAPKCYDCHTMHYVFYTEDIRSGVHERNLLKTCSQCHAKEANGPGLLAAFSVSRVKGHGKANMAGNFRVDQCLNCHFEIAGHGNDEISPAICTKCHISEETSEAVMLGPFHKAGNFQNNDRRFAIILMYGIGIAIIAFTFMSAAGKKYVEPQQQKKE